MNIIFGFGVTEEETARQIIKECADAIEATDKDHKNAVEKVYEKYSDLDKKYKPMKSSDAPERYSYFFYSYYEMYPGNCVVKFSFHHINRQHPFSDDGWAMLATEWILAVDRDDGVTIYKQVG